MTYGMNQFEAQYAARREAQEALRQEMAMQHSLREAGIISRRPGLFARFAAVIRRPIAMGRTNSRVGESAEAYGD